MEIILELLSSGMTTDEILADYDDLEYEDILAVLAFPTQLTQVIKYSTIDFMKFLIDAQLPVRIANLLKNLVMMLFIPKIYL